MTLKSGLAAQFGFAAEATTAIGTRVTPTRFLEFVSEDITFTKQRIESAGLRAGRRLTHRWAAGIQEVSGSFSVEMAAQGTGLLLKHAIGGVSTTGSNPYVHTFTPGALDSLALTIQVGRPDHSGTVNPFDYSGCSITSWELMAEVNQFLMARFSVYGMKEVTSESLASASYPSTYSPFVFTQGKLEIASSAFCVRSATVSGDNALETGRHRICGTNNAQPKVAIESGLRTYGGTISADFESLTAYNRFVNGTEAALSLEFDAGASAKLVISGNVRFDGDTPNVSGPELLEQSLPFKFISSTSDSAAFSAVLTNADSTP
jgi:hypothetical protein